MTAQAPAGIERVHLRLDEVMEKLSDIGTGVAVLQAETATVKLAVETLRERQHEHEKRIASLEQDRSRLSGWMAGIAAAGALGGAGAGAVLNGLGILP